MGGSYLALTDLREATHDVDTVTPLRDATRQAIEEVASEMGLPPRWLNDNAAQFKPAGLTEAAHGGRFGPENEASTDADRQLCIGVDHERGSPEHPR